MNKNKINLLSLSLNKILFFSIIISILGFITDVKNTFKSGGTDLRNRVIGARLLIKEIDPYHYQWKKNESDLFLDPCSHPLMPVSRVTVPPTVLTLHSIIASFSYKTQRIIWFVFQWILFICSLLLFSITTNSKNKSKLIWITGLLFISGSSFWRLHIDLGQIYILYVFLIALSFWLSQQNFKFSPYVSGFFIGITASLRPPAIFMMIPFLIYKRWKLVISNLIGLMTGLCSSFIFANIFTWKSYISAMQIWGKIHIGLIKDYRLGYSKSIVEGMDNLTKMVDIPLNDSSFQGLFKKFLGVNLTSDFLIISLASIIIFFSYLMYKSSIKHNRSTSNLFLFGIILVFISEFFIPAKRLSYYDVIWIVPLSLLIINCDLIKLLLSPLSIFLSLGFIFSTSFHLMLHGPLISDYAILFYTVLIFVFLLSNKDRFENNPETYTVPASKIFKSWRL